MNIISDVYYICNQKCLFNIIYRYVPPQKRKSNGQSHKSSDSRSRSDEPSSTPNRVDTPLSPVVVVEESPKEVVQTDFSGDPPTLLPEQNNSPLVRVAKMKELKNFKDNFKVNNYLLRSNI